MTTRTTTTPAPAVAVPLVTALSAMWEAIRDRHPDVPPVVVTVGAGSIGAPAGTMRLGHFATGRWQVGDTETSELFVAGEGLRAGAPELLATLLHEAAHGLADTRQVQDTSRQGRYHNKQYRRLAEELGLTVAQAPGIGWSTTSLATGTADAYTTELANLSAALVAFRHPEEQTRGRNTNAKDNNPKAATCPCGRRIRVAVSVLEPAPITCGACEGPFTIPEEN